MAASATVTIAGQITGLPSGSITLTGTITSAAPPGEVLPVTLASGVNTINVPTGAVAVLIQPPANNTAILTLKGITGDTGIVLGLTFPALIPLASTQSTIVINSSALTTAPTVFSFV